MLLSVTAPETTKKNQDSLSVSPSPRPLASSVISICEKSAPMAAEIWTMARQFVQPGRALATWPSGEIRA
jgi:hypothetical protein